MEAPEDGGPRADEQGPARLRSEHAAGRRTRRSRDRIAPHCPVSGAACRTRFGGRRRARNLLERTQLGFWLRKFESAKMNPICHASWRGRTANLQERSQFEPAGSAPVSSDSAERNPNLVFGFWLERTQLGFGMRGGT